MRRYENEAVSHASREIVWAVLSDHANMSSWCGTILRADRVQDGDDALDGVGAVRRLITPGGPVREEITAFEPPTRMTYRVVSGMPTVSDYTGETTLSDHPDGGTHIRWVTSFRVPPLLGSVTAFLVSQGTRSLARDLARAADARATA